MPNKRGSCEVSGKFSRENLSHLDSGQGHSKCCAIGGAHIPILLCGAMSAFHRECAVYCYRDQETFKMALEVSVVVYRAMRIFPL